MPDNADCLFCKIIAGEIPASIVAEDDRTVAFMDIAPATRGHMLVVPRAHSTDLHDAAEADVVAVHLMARQMAARLVQRLDADGVNILQSNGPAAWQTVFHLHVHVIPRYAGDPLRLPWEPRAGDQAQIAEAARLLA